MPKESLRRETEGMKPVRGISPLATPDPAGESDSREDFCTERIPGGTDGLLKGHVINAVLMASE